MKLTDIEMAEVQTHIKIVNKAYVKLQQQRNVVQSMEEEFQDFFKELVDRKGGDPEKEYQLDLENKVIISATLIGTEGDPALIRSRLKENIKYRKDTQPSAIYNAGSVFKNTDQYSAGELIDKAELKGFSIDGVKVSNKHANFFVASKGANSSSLYKLVNHVKEVVDSKFGVSLQKEILFVGKFD